MQVVNESVFIVSTEGIIRYKLSDFSVLSVIDFPPSLQNLHDLRFEYQETTDTLLMFEKGGYYVYVYT